MFRLAEAAAALIVAGAAGAARHQDDDVAANARPLPRRWVPANLTAACELKPGIPAVYKIVCDLAAHNETQCKAENLTCAWGMPPAPPAMHNYTCEGTACVPDPGGNYSGLGNCSVACQAPPPSPAPPAPAPCPPPRPHTGNFAACTTKDSRWEDCYCGSADPASWPPTWSSLQNGPVDGNKSDPRCCLIEWLRDPCDEEANVRFFPVHFCDFQSECRFPPCSSFFQNEMQGPMTQALTLSHIEVSTVQVVSNRPRVMHDLSKCHSLQVSISLKQI